MVKSSELSAVSSMERWKGRIAFVSGASRGIGAEICRQLVQHGMIVIGCARSVELIKAIAEEEAVRESAGELHAMKCDLSSVNEIRAMFKEIDRRFGVVHVCVNNAGFSTTSSFSECLAEDLKNLLEVNFMAVSICTRECLKLMDEKEGIIFQVVQCGSVIDRRDQLSQWTVSKPSAGYSMYIGVNAAILALTDALKQELENECSRVRIMCITQDSVLTRFLFGIMPVEEANQKFKYAFRTEANVIAGHVISILKRPTDALIENCIMCEVDFLKDNTTQL